MDLTLNLEYDCMARNIKLQAKQNCSNLICALHLNNFSLDVLTGVKKILKGFAMESKLGLTQYHILQQGSVFDEI